MIELRMVGFEEATAGLGGGFEEEEVAREVDEPPDEERDGVAALGVVAVAFGAAAAGAATLAGV